MHQQHRLVRGDERVISELGCTLAQGYYLSRPVPADELTGWLRNRRTAEADGGIRRAA